LPRDAQEDARSIAEDRLWGRPKEDIAQAGRRRDRAFERARASGLRSEPLRRFFVAGRIAMRSILGRYPGVGAPRDLQFAYGPHGRPSLAARNGPHFNFTRSGPLALCAVARTTAVGVDVECVRAIPEAASITRQYFSAREQAALASLDMPPESAVGYQAALAIRARGVTLRFWRWSAD
jgi:4'-phosphopantetheinyl transferase